MVVINIHELTIVGYMAMVSVFNWQPTGGLMVQADQLGPKVGGHLAPCCTLRVNQGELSQCCYSMITAP